MIGRKMKILQSTVFQTWKRFVHFVLHKKGTREQCVKMSKGIVNQQRLKYNYWKPLFLLVY